MDVVRVDIGGLEAGELALGDEEKVALAEQAFGAGIGKAGGDLGVFGGRDGADEADGEVGLDEGADDESGGFLGAGDEMDAGLAAALGEASEGEFHGFAAGLDEVGEFVEDDDDARVGASLGITALHLGDEAGEGVEGEVGAGDNGEEEVREEVEGSEAAGLGVDEEELEGGRGVEEGEGGDDGAGESSLARAGGAGDEDVSDVGRGEAEEERDAVVVEAEEGGMRRDGGVGVVGEAVEEVEEEDGLRGGARDLDVELVVLAKDAARGSAEGEGNLLGEALELVKADAERGGEMEADEARGDATAGDARRKFVGGEDELDAIGLEVERVLHGDLLD